MSTAPAARGHRAYGLTLESSVEWPELPPVELRGDADVTLAFQPLTRPTTGVRRAGRFFVATRDEVFLRWPQLGSLSVRRGREIVVDPVCKLDARDLRAYVLGPAFGVLLQQRGYLALHGSSVERDGAAVAFVGESGSGKSTTAAHFYRRGYALLADDVTAVSLRGGLAAAAPAYPRIKLTREAAAVLPAAAGESIPSDPQKSFHGTSRGFPERCVPLEHVFVLQPARRYAACPLSAREGFLELVRHSFAVRVLPALDPSQHLRVAAALAAAVRVTRIEVARSLAGLDDLQCLIEEERRRARPARAGRATARP